MDIQIFKKMKTKKWCIYLNVNHHYSFTLGTLYIYIYIYICVCVYVCVCVCWTSFQNSSQSQFSTLTLTHLFPAQCLFPTFCFSGKYFIYFLFLLSFEVSPSSISSFFRIHSHYLLIYVYMYIQIVKPQLA